MKRGVRGTAYRIPGQRLGVLFDRVGIDLGLEVGVATGLKEKGPSNQRRVCIAPHT